MASHASKHARGDRSRISTAVLVNELDQNDAQSAVERELFLSRKGADEGEERASPVLHRRFDAQRLLSKKTARMGDKAKPLVSHMAGGFAVFEAAFLCWPTHRELSKRSQMPMRLTLQGR
jgi:hypothetical protein